MKQPFDLTVMGGGSAGVAAALRAAELGARVCLVECARVGGYQVNHGSSFLQAAGFAAGRHAGPGGRPLEEARNAVAALSRKWDETLKARKIELLRGSARLVGAGTVAVAPLKPGEPALHVQSRNVVLATGSEPTASPPLAFDGRFVFSAEEASDWKDEELPQQLLVVGGGKTACEIASLFNRLGCRVFLSDAAPHLLAGTDPEVALGFEDELKKRKVKLLLSKKIVSIYKKSENELDVTLDGDVKFSVGRVIVAGGSGNARDCGAAEAGVRLGGRREIWVDEFLQTTVSGVFAAGSILGGGHDELLSADQGRAAAESALARERSGGRCAFRREVVPFAVFAAPQVASVGLHQADAHLRGYRAVDGKCELAKLDVAQIAGDAAGFVKVTVDRASHKVIGVHMLGNNVADLQALATLAVQKEMAVNELASLTVGSRDRHQALRRAARACIRYLAGKR